jgi:transposase-like protein
MRRPGQQPMVGRQRAFAKLLQQGVSISEACRRLGIDRKTGHWWKNGGSVATPTGARVIEPVIGRYQRTAESNRYLSAAERTATGLGSWRARFRLSWVGRRRPSLAS